MGKRSKRWKGDERARGKEEDRKRKEKLPWVRSKEKVPLRAGQLELRTAQMKHSNNSGISVGREIPIA